MRKEDIKHGDAPHMQFTIFSFHNYLGQIKVEKKWIQCSLSQILNHLMALASILYRPPKLGYLGNPRLPNSILY